MTGYEFTGYIIGSCLFDKPKPHFCSTRTGMVYTEYISSAVDHTRVCLIRCDYFGTDISIDIEYRVFRSDNITVHMILSGLTLPILIQHLDKTFVYAQDILQSNIGNKIQWSEYLDSYKKWCKESMREYNLEQINR